jgi:hypothetical protein
MFVIVGLLAVALTVTGLVIAPRHLQRSTNLRTHR